MSIVIDVTEGSMLLSIELFIYKMVDGMRMDGQLRKIGLTCYAGG